MLQGKGNNSSREEPPGVIKGLNQKTVQENFVLLGDDINSITMMKEETVPGPLFCPCTWSDDGVVPALRVIAYMEEHKAAGVKNLLGVQVFFLNISPKSVKQ